MTSSEARRPVAPAPSEGNTLPRGTRLAEQYEVERLLGSGGFGNTYLALDTTLEAHVAVKEYLPSQVGTRHANGTVGPTSPAFKGNYDAGLRQFRREARILAKLGRFNHPQIVRVNTAFDAFGTTYMVMDYVQGRTLAEELGLGADDEVTSHTRPLPHGRVRDILFALLDGLQTVHAADILHRDIKPSNVMLRPDGSPVLIDFGAAEDMFKGSQLAAFSPGYSPIEQYARTRTNQGAWTDVYALGATTYVALTGRAPADAAERMLNDTLVPLASATSGRVTGGLARTVEAMLAVAPDVRPQSMQHVRELIDGGNDDERGVTWKAWGGLVATIGLVAVAVWWSGVVDPQDLPVVCPTLNEEGETGLHAAAEENDPDAVRTLVVENRCDPDQTDDVGETALHQAVYYGRKTAAVALLEVGADPNPRTDTGATPLHYAGRRSGRVVPGPDGSVAVSEQQALGVATTLLDHGADIDAMREDGRTALHVAASTSRPEVVGELLERGANVDALNEDGHTPLQLAIWAAAVPGRVGLPGEDRQGCGVVEALLAAGADAGVAENTPGDRARWQERCEP